MTIKDYTLTKIEDSLNYLISNKIQTIAGAAGLCLAYSGYLYMQSRPSNRIITITETTAFLDGHKSVIAEYIKSMRPNLRELNRLNMFTKIQGHFNLFGDFEQEQAQAKVILRATLNLNDVTEQGKMIIRYQDIPLVNGKFIAKYLVNNIIEFKEIYIFNEATKITIETSLGRTYRHIIFDYSSKVARTKIAKTLVEEVARKTIKLEDIISDVKIIDAAIAEATVFQIGYNYLLDSLDYLLEKEYDLAEYLPLVNLKNACDFIFGTDEIQFY